MKLAVSEEAVNQVWSRFQTAMEKLDPSNLEMLQEFLSGSSLADVGKSRNLSVEQTRVCLDQIKREVTQHLRTTIKVRQ